MELTHEAEALRAGDLEVRPAEHLALAKGRVLALSERELGLLAALVRRQGRIVPREELYATVWRAELRPDDRSVDVYVHKLWAKLTAPCRSAGSSTRTSASATGSRLSLHTPFTWGPITEHRMGTDEEPPTAAGTGPRGRAGDRGRGMR